MFSIFSGITFKGSSFDGHLMNEQQVNRIVAPALRSPNRNGRTGQQVPSSSFFWPNHTPLPHVLYCGVRAMPSALSSNIHHRSRYRNGSHQFAAVVCIGRRLFVLCAIRVGNERQPRVAGLNNRPDGSENLYGWKRMLTWMPGRVNLVILQG